MVAADDNDAMEEKARAFLKRYNSEVQDVMYQVALKSWAYYTNLTEYNSEQMVSYTMLCLN